MLRIVYNAERSFRLEVHMISVTVDHEIYRLSC